MRQSTSATWLALCLFAAGAAAAQAPPRTPAPAAPEPIVAPRADQLLREMSDYLRAAPQFSFHASVTFDDFLPTGQQIQLAARYEAAVRRPDRVYSEFWGDAGSRHFWYDGKRITLYDPALGLYATRAAAATIDTTLQQLTADLGFTPPLSDLMTADPYLTLRANVLAGLYVGETEVDGVHCHHLAFVERDVDWQVWITEGTRRLPRKVLITYKRMPGAPRFGAILSEWDLATRPPDALFVPQLPPGTDEIPFMTAAGKLTGGKSGGAGR